MIAIAVLPSAAQDYVPPDRPPPEIHQVQGEYSGTIEGGEKLGAWVVAMGGTNFNVVFLKGGLLDIPGQEGGGWDKTTKFSGNGTQASLTAQGYTGAITGTGENRVLAGKTPDGKSFTLNRMMRKSPTQGMQPKQEWNAVHWFRSNTAADLSNWSARPSAPQLKYGGYLFRGVTCTKSHATMYLHIEARSPFCPTCRDQSRGNSGIYLRGMHEMQVLDSFGQRGADNELGSIYRVKAPIVNAALPPLTWQTYDCFYTVTSANSATMTVYLNGVLVQDKTPVNGITEAGFAGNSLYLQDHGSEVTFGNIWAVPLATEATLPWSDILAHANPSVPLKMDRKAILAPPAQQRPVAELFGLQAGRDVSGRAVAEGRGRSLLLIQPIR
jgi:hypothetical protein